MAAKKKPVKTKADKPRLSRGRTRDGAIFPVAPLAASLPTDYAATLQEIKTHLRSARIRAVLAANPIVIESYWHTGKINKPPGAPGSLTACLPTSTKSSPT
jgi:hypothetical protein